MRPVRVRQLLVHMCASAMVLLIIGCGETSDKPPTMSSAQRLRYDARALQEAMESSRSVIDEVRGTRDSLDELEDRLFLAIFLTDGVIVRLTIPAAFGGTERKLSNAARKQRSFLQFAVDSTRTRSQRAANSALQRACDDARRATTAYAAITQQSSHLAGLLPPAKTFNIGRLRDAVRTVNQGSPNLNPTRCHPHDCHRSRTTTAARRSAAGGCKA